jgi:O-antigen/teichoic acid export membrane protein
MNTEKTQSEAENQPSCLDAVISRFLFVIFFIIVSLIIGLLMIITPFYFIVTGKNWIELLIKKANYYSDKWF